MHHLYCSEEAQHGDHTKTSYNLTCIGPRTHWSLHKGLMADFTWKYFKGQQMLPDRPYPGEHLNQLAIWISAGHWTFYNHQAPPPDSQIICFVSYYNYTLLKILNLYHCQEMWQDILNAEHFLKDVSTHWVLPVAAEYFPIKYQDHLACGRLAAISKPPKPGIKSLQGPDQ